MQQAVCVTSTDPLNEEQPETPYSKGNSGDSSLAY